MISIYTIEDEHLYAVKYDDEEEDEYNRIFDDHSNLAYVLKFFEENKWQIGQYYVKEYGIPRNEIEAYAQRVVEETLELEEYFERLIDNSVNDATPDLLGHFELLEGFEKEDTPAMKSYGLNKPSMLRVYAIEVEKKCLIIFYSGIKIRYSLSECPVLKDNVIRKARQVIDFLQEKEVVSVEDLKNLAE